MFSEKEYIFNSRRQSRNNIERMKQKQDELLKRIQKLMKQNQDLVERNEELQKAVVQLTEQNEQMKMHLSEARVERKELPPGKAEERIRKYKMATVLFAYIGGFKHLTDEDESEAIMDQLDEVLIEFDTILKKYKIQKIKTIGDTYMAAGGIPEKNITNPIDVVMAALEMNNFLDRIQGRKGTRYWRLSLTTRPPCRSSCLSVSYTHLRAHET